MNVVVIFHWYVPLPLLLIHGPRLRRHETEKTVLQAAGEDEGVLAADQTLAYQLNLLAA